MSLIRCIPIIIGIALLAPMSSCTERMDAVAESPGEQIEAFLEAEQLVDRETTTASGLVYIIESPGEQEHPTLADQITINYRGYTQTGGTFDETDGSPRTFPLANLIPAWQEAIPLIGRGGKIKILAPPDLAYGPTPPGAIPPGAVLVFDIELIDF